MKIFISGSAGFGSAGSVKLPEIVKSYILSFTGHEILIGDCNLGIDKEVQTALAGQTDIKVTVYAMDNKVRCNMGNFPVKSVANAIKGSSRRAYFTQKDEVMCKDCDAALAIWDGKSVGTKANIDKCIAMNKHVIVYRLDLGRYESYEPAVNQA